VQAGLAPPGGFAENLFFQLLEVVMFLACGPLVPLQSAQQQAESFPVTHAGLFCLLLPTYIRPLESH
jgi:hypothetical protein